MFKYYGNHQFWYIVTPRKSFKFGLFQPAFVCAVYAFKNTELLPKHHFSTNQLIINVLVFHQLARSINKK